MHRIKKTLSFWVITASFYLSFSALAEDVHTKSDITLGMSSAFSGINSNMGHDLAEGLNIAFSRYNQSNSPKIKLVTKDDAYDPALTATNLREMIDNDHIIAMINNLGAPTGVVSARIAEQERMLLFAPVTGVPYLHPDKEDPTYRYMIHYRSNYDEEVKDIFMAMTNAAPLSSKDIALFYQKNTVGNGGEAWLASLIEKHSTDKQSHFLKIGYDRGSGHIENAVADLLIAVPTPKIIFMSASGEPSARFIKLVRQYGLDPLFVGVSFIGTTAFADMLKDTQARVVITQVVPPLSYKHLPIIQAFEEDRKRYLQQTAPKQTPLPASSLMLEAYISARILTKAIENKPYINRTSLIDALEGLGKFDLGLGIPLRLDHDHHQASHKTWLTYLKGGKYIPIDYNEVGTLIPKEKHNE